MAGGDGDGDGGIIIPMTALGIMMMMIIISLEPCEYAELPKLPLPPLQSTMAHLLDNLK